MPSKYHRNQDFEAASYVWSKIDVNAPKALYATLNPKPKTCVICVKNAPISIIRYFQHAGQSHEYKGKKGAYNK